VSAAPTVIRTKNFVADAPAFILEQAGKAMVERNEFRIALSGGNTPQIAAQEYEDQLDAIATGRGEPIYKHDLILLGLGDDGHTASLFPGTAALDEMTRRVVANFVPKLNAWRLTFTFPLVNHARHILFLVGASKSPELIERVLAGDPQFPAARVNPIAGEVTWMIGE
jgi:6-phosphogluconolactonase